MTQRYSPAFFVSIVLHVIVLLILIVSFEFSSTMPVLENADQNMKVINATIMDAPPAPSLPEPTPAPIPEPPKPEPIVEKNNAQAEAEAAAAAAKLLAAQKQAEVQKQQAIALKEQRKKQLAKQQEDIAKQLLEDMKKQNDKTKKMKQKAAQKALEKELQAEAEKALQQHMLSEQKRAGSAKAQGEVNKYKALILQAISRRWLVPSGVNRDLSSQLLIRLAPDGSVLDVQITKSSGDISLDRSARDAVYKASPLPVPDNADEFDQFRQFVLKVKPKDLIPSEFG